LILISDIEAGRAKTCPILYIGDSPSNGFCIVGRHAEDEKGEPLRSLPPDAWQTR
jgi:hypothetical protein